MESIGFVAGSDGSIKNVGQSSPEKGTRKDPNLVLLMNQTATQLQLLDTRKTKDQRFNSYSKLASSCFVPPSFRSPMRQNQSTLDEYGNHSPSARLRTHESTLNLTSKLSRNLSEINLGSQQIISRDLEPTGLGKHGSFKKFLGNFKDNKYFFSRNRKLIIRDSPMLRRVKADKAPRQQTSLLGDIDGKGFCIQSDSFAKKNEVIGSKTLESSHSKQMIQSLQWNQGSTDSPAKRVGSILVKKSTPHGVNFYRKKSSGNMSGGKITPRSQNLKDLQLSDTKKFVIGSPRVSSTANVTHQIHARISQISSRKETRLPSREILFSGPNA